MVIFSQKGGVMNFAMFMCFVSLPMVLNNKANLPVNQPEKNVWEALAQAADLDSICLTHSRPGRPFSACMIGLPVSEWPIPGHTAIEISQVVKDPVNEWYTWIHSLPVASSEPQELEIFGSMTMNVCMKFEISGTAKPNKTIDVTPSHEFYRNASAWCNNTMVTDKGSLQVPVQLPRGFFLICGDRIWHGIPANAKGGPCSIGRISMLTPDLKMQKEQKHKEKRSLQYFDENCDDRVYTWSKARRIAIAIFSPQAASGIALTQLDRMGCWLSKHAQSVSLALSDMLQDMNSVRQATLQNRAAIDYLLLAHGHGCKEFEGMCCMNLSDHSRSIHENIEKIEESVKKLGEITGSWIEDMAKFFDLSPLGKEILKIGFQILVILIVLLIVIPCILLCVRGVMSRVVKRVLLVQTEGGDVGAQYITPDVQSYRDNPWGARRPWNVAKSTWWLDFDPFKEMIPEGEEMRKFHV
ncbi:uncharacterized protein LOC135298693 isoform X1 [Passer domesticus]|uniref:uncharacterized protein LOC135298693 isoform X1 n=1 Tax=Passer domesticus TaxID=48849 RepID=UPI0030FE8982